MLTFNAFCVVASVYYCLLMHLKLFKDHNLFVLSAKAHGIIWLLCKYYVCTLSSKQVGVALCSRWTLTIWVQCCAINECIACWFSKTELIWLWYSGNTNEYKYQLTFGYRKIMKWITHLYVWFISSASILFFCIVWFWSGARGSSIYHQLSFPSVLVFIQGGRRSCGYLSEWPIHHHQNQYRRYCIH